MVQATVERASTGKRLSLADLEEVARQVRIRIVQMIHRAGSGHVASSLSCADLVTALRFAIMAWEGPADRDRLILSKGHAAPAWYSALLVAGDVDPSLVESLRVIDSPFQGHPDRLRLEYVDASTGALGQGMSLALGRALAIRLTGVDRRVFAILGDGECQEGQVWEALGFGAAHQVDNVTVFLDHNKAQSDGPLDDVMPLGDITAKFAAFGWDVQRVDGHDMRALTQAATAADTARGRPSVVICDTEKGHLSDGEIALDGSHGATFDDATAAQALRILGVRP